VKYGGCGSSNARVGKTLLGSNGSTTEEQISAEFARTLVDEKSAESALRVQKKEAEENVEDQRRAVYGSGCFGRTKCYRHITVTRNKTQIQKRRGLH